MTARAEPLPGEDARKLWHFLELRASSLSRLPSPPRPYLTLACSTQVLPATLKLPPLRALLGCLTSGCSRECQEQTGHPELDPGPTSYHCPHAPHN